MAASSAAPLPPLVTFPDKQIQEHIPRDAWAACLDARSSLGKFYLHVPSERFSDNLSPSSSLTTFLTSYVSEGARDVQHHPQKHQEEVKALRETVFLLAHRALTEARDVPNALLEWKFLADFAVLYGRYQATAQVLAQVWLRHRLIVEKSVQRFKMTVISAPEPKGLEVWQDISHLAHLVRIMPAIGELLLTGTDFLDACNSTYSFADSTVTKQVLALVYLSLLSLVQQGRPNVSLLVEQLYSLQSSTQVPKLGSKPLVVALVSNTSLLHKLRSSLKGSDAKRAQSVLDLLSKVVCAPQSERRNRQHRITDKGKGKADAPATNLHPHRLSLITQVQDVFPDLGSAFILHLLDHYADDTESIIAALLEDNLPPHLSTLDRTTQLPSSTSIMQDEDHHEHLIPHSPSPAPNLWKDQLPQRRSKYDDDAFDRLEISSSQLHRGRAGNDATADELLAKSDQNSSEHTKAKAAIFSALAAFDPDDDERDDTYDAEDVGGTVDTGHTDDGDAEAANKVDEQALWRAWRSNAAVFERVQRRGKQREQLKNETGMIDEGIEGWATMLKRDPRRMQRLERTFEAFSGQQNQIGSTRWQRTEDEDGESGSGQESGRARGSFRGGGRGRGRGGGRGSVAGAANEKSTQIARDKKETNKSGAANHNRRDQRARKMGRGGFPG